MSSNEINIKMKFICDKFRSTPPLTRQGPTNICNVKIFIGGHFKTKINMERDVIELGEVY